MATQITATLPTLDFPREVDYPTQEDWAAFSAAAELNFGILGNGWSTQMQNWKDQANAMSIELNNNAGIAQSIANYQGDWVPQGYTLGQSVSVSGVYYICKLTHITGQNPTTGGSTYWNLALGNWSLKVDTNMSGYTSKNTPVDADLIPLSDSTVSFGIKKLSWANLKASLISFFMDLSSNQTIAGNKNFTGDLLMTGANSLIGYGIGSGGTVTQLTNKSTSVVLNKSTGKIIMSNSALAAGETVSFFLTNTVLSENDTISFNLVGGYAAYKTYTIDTSTTNGSLVRIIVNNISAGSLSEALILKFSIIKGAVA